MLLLTSTSDLIVVNSGSAASLEVHASWVDNATGTITPGRTNTAAITGTGDTTVVASPGASTQRNVKLLSVRNDHATNSTAIDIKHTDGTNPESLWKGTLLAQESVHMNAEGDFVMLDANGTVKPGSGSVATQAQMEAAASNAVFATPGNLQYHPGVAKLVMFTTGTATPVASTPPTFGCTLTDTGVGQLTVNFNTSFSTTTGYAIQANVEVISTTLTAAANVMQAYMRFGGGGSVSSCQLNCCDRTATTNVIRDPTSWHVVAYGDYA